MECCTGQGRLERRGAEIFDTQIIEQHEGVRRRVGNGRERVHVADHDVARSEDRRVGALGDNSAVENPNQDVIRLAQLNLNPVLARRAGGFKPRRGEQILVDGRGVVGSD